LPSIPHKLLKNEIRIREEVLKKPFCINKKGGTGEKEIYYRGGGAVGHGFFSARQHLLRVLKMCSRKKA
jgi:hypothetical protein